MIFDYTILLLVGFIWGSTNYLIEIYYYDYDKIKDYKFPMKMVHFIRVNYMPLIFFILNQSASILFALSLQKISLTLTVIVSNTFSFLINMLFERIHKKKHFDKSKSILLHKIIFFNVKKFSKFF